MTTLGAWLRDGLSGGATAGTPGGSVAEQLRKLEEIRAARAWPMLAPEYEEAAEAVRAGDPRRAAQVLRATGWPGSDRAAAWLEAVPEVQRADRGRDDATADDLARLLRPDGIGQGWTPGGLALGALAAAAAAAVLLTARR